jgi:hypothetical protein
MQERPTCAAGNSPTGPACVNSSHTSSSVTCGATRAATATATAAAAAAARQRAAAKQCMGCFGCCCSWQHHAERAFHALSTRHVLVMSWCCCRHPGAARSLIPHFTQASCAHRRVQVPAVNCGLLVAVVRVLADEVGPRTSSDAAARGRHAGARRLLCLRSEHARVAWAQHMPTEFADDAAGQACLPARVGCATVQLCRACAVCGSTTPVTRHWCVGVM